MIPTTRERRTTPCRRQPFHPTDRGADAHFECPSGTSTRRLSQRHRPRAHAGPTNSRLAWVIPESVSGETRKPRQFTKSPGCASSSSGSENALSRAIGQNGTPEKITIDKSGANTAAIESYNKDHEADIEIRQVKYLNNIVEQDHRAVKRLARPTLGFKSFRSAAATLTGIQLMRMIRKGQLRTKGKLRPAQRYYSLAA